MKPSRPKRKSSFRRKVAKKIPKKKPVKSKAAKKAPVKTAKLPKATIKIPKEAKPKAVKIKEPKQPKQPEIDPSLVEVGKITHYFERIKVCVVELTQGSVLIGDKLTIVGPKTKFIQKVWSMQIESEDVKVAKKGQLIGLKVDKLVAVGDKVYK